MSGNDRKWSGKTRKGDTRRGQDRKGTRGQKEKTGTGKERREDETRTGLRTGEETRGQRRKGEQERRGEKKGGGKKS